MSFNTSYISPQITRARMKALKNVASRYSGELEERYLMQGFVPHNLRDEVNQELQKVKSNFDRSPLTFTEMTSGASFYEANPSRIAGNQRMSSSIFFPVQVQGTKQDVLDTVNHILTTPKTTTKEHKMKKAKAKLAARKRKLKLRGTLDGTKADHSSNLVSAAEKIINSYNDHFSKFKDDNGLDGLRDFETNVKRLNEGISEDEMKAWVWYKRANGVPMHQWKNYYISKENEDTELLRLFKKGVLFFLGQGNDTYVPAPVFIYGNMYDRLKATEKNKAVIVELGDENIYDNHIQAIKNAMPKQLSVMDADPKNRPVISAVGQIAENFKIETTSDAVAIELRSTAALQDVFIEWLRIQDESVFKKSRAYDITYIFIHKERRPRNTDKEAWETRKKYARDEGERLFSEFLHTALTFEDQQKLDFSWNRQYNGHSHIPHHKIPVAFESSDKFHGFDFQLRPAQREGIAFMELTQSGCIAYDVGVGKTITAICTMANAIQNGKCSRPLLVVPKPVYNNWIKEMRGFTQDGKTYEGILSGTDIKINTWNNLGAAYELDYDPKSEKSGPKVINLARPVDEKTITIVTTKGMEKIGFGDDVSNELLYEISNILDQNKQNQSNRDMAKENEKYMEMVGVGQKDTIADIETLGFDYLCVDEAHNYKNLFTGVKVEKGESKRYEISGGTPSNRAIKLFFLAMYIQRNHGRNTMLLTATPFTNSPLEIYSMLSYVALDYFKEMGIYNLQDFFETYIQETSEYVVKQNGKIAHQSVVKSYANRVSLQKIIFNHINFKTGEEANIPRPCKINLPKTAETNEEGSLTKLDRQDQILTYLQMTDKQKAIQEMINAVASERGDRNDPGKHLRAMSDSLNNALSPFIYQNTFPEDYKEFMAESPKLMYTVECIRTVKEYHESRNEEVSGQIIYIDRGKDYFKYIKEYLEKELGYKKKVPVKTHPNRKIDEVEILTGSNASDDKKELIKDAFNDGSCKIIIGTSTIKEGINLQKRGTVTYNCYPNWNPTDMRQLEGRTWRQKNEFGYVRIVMPLMENSMDVFVFQKLDEKSARINDIWSKADRANVLDEESLDPNEVKFALITDLQVLANHEINQQKDELRRSVRIAEQQLQTFQDFETINSNYLSGKKSILESLSSKRERLKGKTVFEQDFVRYGLFNMPDDEVKAKATKQAISDIEKYSNIYDEVSKVINGAAYSDKELLALVRKINFAIGDTYDYTVEHFKEYMKKYVQVVENVLKPRGYKPTDDFDPILEKLAKEKSNLENEFEYIQSNEHYEKTKIEIHKKKAKLAVSGKTVMERVEDFAKLNYLLQYKFSDIDHTSCTIPAPTEADKKATPKVKKSLPVTNLEDSTKNMDAAMLASLPNVNLLVPDHQQMLILDMRTNEYNKILADLEKDLSEIPKKQEMPNAQDLMVHAHYFVGGSDWYITEVNQKEGRMFGYVILDRDYQMSELGYMSIDEITSNGMIEMDFHWTKKTLGEVFKSDHPELYSGDKDEEQKAKEKKIKLAKAKAAARKRKLKLFATA